MKYRTKSAEVLNEADRAQRMLDWQLFCIDQERILYGDKYWEPGDFLWRSPGEIRDAQEMDWEFFNEYPYAEDEDEFGPGFWGNCMRPIFQTYEFEQDQLGEGPSTRYENVLRYRDVRCEPCGVDWGREGGDECWVCGTSYPWPEIPKPLEWKTIPRRNVANVSFGNVEMSVDGITIRGTLDFSPFVDGIRAMGEAAERAVPAFRQLSEHYHAVMQEFTITDEQYRILTGFSRNAYSIGYNMDRNTHVVPYVPPASTNPFRREEREIVLVEPVVPNLPEWGAYRRPVIEFPDGAMDGNLWDRYIPRSTDLDHLRQFTQVQQSAWPGIEIVTERRRQ